MLHYALFINPFGLPGRDALKFNMSHNV